MPVFVITTSSETDVEEIVGVVLVNVLCKAFGIPYNREEKAIKIRKAIKIFLNFLRLSAVKLLYSCFSAAVSKV